MPMSTKNRGGRVFLLLASVLPLLATEDGDDRQHDRLFVRPAPPLLHDKKDGGTGPESNLAGVPLSGTTTTGTAILTTFSSSSLPPPLGSDGDSDGDESYLHEQCGAPADVSDSDQEGPDLPAVDCRDGDDRLRRRLFQQVDGGVNSRRSDGDKALDLVVICSQEDAVAGEEAKVLASCSPYPPWASGEQRQQRFPCLPLDRGYSEDGGELGWCGEASDLPLLVGGGHSEPRNGSSFAPTLLSFGAAGPAAAPGSECDPIEDGELVLKAAAANVAPTDSTLGESGQRSSVHDGASSLEARDTTASAEVASGAVIDEEGEERLYVNAVDYASKSAGGLVIDKSKNFKGTSNLLTSDRDRYAIVECHEPSKWVVIGLSEDILVKRVGLAMYERYSSHVKDFALLAASTTTGGSDSWRSLGNFTAAPVPGEQIFDMKVPVWARYVKLVLLSHYGQEHYCTVSQVKVHGSTVLQGFHEQWQETDGDAGEDDDASEADDGEAKDSQLEPEAGSVAGDSESDVTLTAAAPTLEKQSAGAAKQAEESANPSTAEIGPSARGKSRDDSNASHGNLPPRNARTEDDGDGRHRALVPGRGRFDSTYSTSGSCLPAAATPSRSRELADLGFAESKSTLFVRWSWIPLDLSLLAAASTRLGTTAYKSDEPFIVASLSETCSVGNSLRVSALPLVLHIRRQNEVSGWGISVDGITSLQRSVRALQVDSVASMDCAESSLARQSHPPAIVSNTTSADCHHEPPRHLAIPEILTSQNGRDAKEMHHSTEFDQSRGIQESVTGSRGEIKSYLQERYPAASCLTKLDSTALRLGQVKRGSGSGHGSVSGAQSGAGGMEPVFKKLTDEIKALQAGLAAYDEWTKESVACYQKVLFEIFLDMESQRHLQELRLQKLENDSFKTGFVVTARSFLVQLVSMVLRLLDLLLMCEFGLLGLCLRSVSVAFLVGTIVVKAIREIRRRPRNHHWQSSDNSMASSCATSVPDLCAQMPEKPKVVTLLPIPGSTPVVSPLPLETATSSA